MQARYLVRPVYNRRRGEHVKLYLVYDLEAPEFDETPSETTLVPFVAVLAAAGPASKPTALSDFLRARRISDWHMAAPRIVTDREANRYIAMAV